MRPTAAEVTSSSAPKSEPAADEVADTLAPAQKKNKNIGKVFELIQSSYDTRQPKNKAK